MGEILNPFGIRNGEIIAIRDVSESEKGLKCNCVCPNCGGVFQARMGNVREWHFAHTKDGCDSEIAFLRGLYMLLKRYIDEKNAIPLPSITLYAVLGETEEINKENCLNYVTIQKTYSCNYIQQVRTAKRCTFISCEIVNCNKKPIYLLAKTEKKKLAIIIEPPKISCNGLKRSDIDEDACLKLNLKSIDYQELTKLETVFSLFNNEAYYKWGKNITTIYKYLDDIAKANRDFIKEKEEQEQRCREQKQQNQKEREKKENERRQQEKQNNMMRDLHYAFAIIKRNGTMNNSTFLKNEKLSQQNTFEREYMDRYNYVKDKFNQQERQIYDYAGKRWIQCEQCGKIKEADDFSSYGGKNHINLGICSECSRKSRQKI